jgi:hypothetical protein
MRPIYEKNNLMTAEEVADSIGVNYHTVMRLARQYETGEKLGIYSRKLYGKGKARRYFAESDVEDYMSRWMEAHSPRAKKHRKRAEDGQ